jgi:type I restriction enzyme S subunit
MDSIVQSSALANAWQTITLGEVCEVIAGQSPEGRYYNTKGHGVPFYQGKKEFTERFLGEPTTWTTNTTKEAYANDILMSVRAPVGPINFATQKICIGRGLAAIRAKNTIDRDFLYSFLLHFESEIVGNTGAVFNSINKAQIENIRIPLPPLPEQHRIVKILDEVFDAVARAKANAEKNLQNARELFESYLQSVFANPCDDWEKKEFGQVCENLDSKRIPVTKKDRTGGKYPYFGASGIVDSVNGYIFNEDLLLVSEDGANLLARTYPIAFSISGPAWVNNHAHVVRFQSRISQSFVEYYLNSIRLDPFVSGMAQPKLNQKMLNSILLPWPNLNEQTAIVEQFDALSTETKKLEAIYKSKLSSLEELKKSVLKQAFSGKL